MQPSPAKSSMRSSTESASRAIAFDISFGDDTPLSGSKRRLPPRLKSLERRPDRDLAAVQRDMAAKQARADSLREQRRSQRAARSHSETEKAKMVHTHMVREKTILGDTKLEENEQAMQDREQHLQLLRTKLQEQKNRKSKPRQLVGRAH